MSPVQIPDRADRNLIWDEGYRAGWKGMDRTTCPFYDTVDSNDWNDGWFVGNYDRNSLQLD